MSLYAVHRLCHQLLHDPAFRAQVQTDPEAALAPLDLSPEERRALLEGDVGRLYRMGANTFLLAYLPRYGVFGLDLPAYNARIQCPDAGRAARHPGLGPLSRC